VKRTGGHGQSYSDDIGDALASRRGPPEGTAKDATRTFYEARLLEMLA
jgi:hypothetical protein